MIARAFAADLDEHVEGVRFDPDGAAGNIFVAREMPSSPDVAVLVLAPLAPTSDRLPHAWVNLQLLVRGARRAVEAHDALCGALIDHLDCRPAGVIGADPHTARLVGCTFASMAPLGDDANQRPETSLNFRALIHNPTSHRSTSP